jgi:nitroimidazol reductase NimA-like FMN-containing flavoprotein (pyridoxamine 5'-phosphate oxidase superfamily)
MTSADLDVLDERECRQLLGGRTFGRVGVQLGTELVVLPVYYAIVDGDIVFRTSPGTKLAAALLGARVAFEIDNPSPGWSVLVRGHARELREPHDEMRARTALGNDWPAGAREHYVRIATEVVTGRRLRA